MALAAYLRWVALDAYHKIKICPYVKVEIEEDVFSIVERDVSRTAMLCCNLLPLNFSSCSFAFWLPIVVSVHTTYL